MDQKLTLKRIRAALAIVQKGDRVITEMTVEVPVVDITEDDAGVQVSHRSRAA